MRKIDNTIWRFSMDPILRFLRRIDSDEKVGVNSLGKMASVVANEMIRKGILVKRIPENSRSFKYCIANRQLFEDYSKKEFPLGLYAMNWTITPEKLRQKVEEDLRRRDLKLMKKFC